MSVKFFWNQHNGDVGGVQNPMFLSRTILKYKSAWVTENSLLTLLHTTLTSPADNGRLVEYKSTNHFLTFTVYKEGGSRFGYARSHVASDVKSVWLMVLCPWKLLPEKNISNLVLQTTVFCRRWLPSHARQNESIVREGERVRIFVLDSRLQTVYFVACLLPNRYLYYQGNEKGKVWSCSGCKWWVYRFFLVFRTVTGCPINIVDYSNCVNCYQYTVGIPHGCSVLFLNKTFFIRMSFSFS